MNAQAIIKDLAGSFGYWRAVEIRSRRAGLATHDCASGALKIVLYRALFNAPRATRLMAGREIRATVARWIPRRQAA